MKSLLMVVFVLLAILLPSSPRVLGDSPKTWVLDDFEDGDL